MNRDALGPLLASVEKQLAQLNADSVTSRIWVHDPTLWTDDPDGQAEIKVRLGWLHLPETSRELAKEAMDFAHEVKKAGISKILLLGMGGSSLGPEVMARTFDIKPATFSILDSTDPAEASESGFVAREALGAVEAADDFFHLAAVFLCDFHKQPT